MFSDRRLDGIERDRELFFKRAKTGSYRHRKTGEMIAHDPATGGAQKDRFWNHKNRPQWARKLYERYVQQELSDFALVKSKNPEPKIGPKLKRATPEYEAQRVAIERLVMDMRAVQREIEVIEKELIAVVNSPEPQIKVIHAVKGRSDARWSEFEHAILDIGQREYNLSFVTLSPAINAIEPRFSELADTLKQQGRGVGELARMLAEQLTKAELEHERDRALHAGLNEPESRTEEVPDGPEL